VARAGFWAIQSTKIRFGRDGRWYADGEPIANARIADLFSRHVVRQPDGSYRIEIGWDKAPIEVEDTPFVVRRTEAEPGGGFDVELNDGSREPLDLDSLEISGEHVLYCRVKGGAESARFLRPAYYQLAPYIEERAGGFVVRAGGREHGIAERSGSPRRSG
jgi:hypothetical protein